MIRLALIFLIAILGSSALAGEPQSNEAPSISAAELHDRRTSGEAPVVIDVRTPEEYAAGHVPGAVNIPFDQVAERIVEVDAPHGVALYCMVGPRARKGESALLAIERGNFASNGGVEKLFDNWPNRINTGICIKINVPRPDKRI